MATVTCRHSFLFSPCCTNISCGYLVLGWRLMNLREFINYKTHCPLCDEQLKNVFNSKNRIIYLKDDKFLVVIDLKSLKRGQKNYQATITVDLVTNDFHVEFQRYGGRQLGDATPLFLIERFRQFINNSLMCKVYSYCNCKKYSYHSQYFDLNLKSSKLNDLILYTESFDDMKINDNLIGSIWNDHCEKKTTISLLKIPAESPVAAQTNIDLPFITFTSRKEVENALIRAKNLLIFS